MYENWSGMTISPAGPQHTKTVMQQDWIKALHDNWKSLKQARGAAVLPPVLLLLLLLLGLLLLLRDATQHCGQCGDAKASCPYVCLSVISRSRFGLPG